MPEKILSSPPLKIILIKLSEKIGDTHDARNVLSHYDCLAYDNFIFDKIDFYL